MIVRLVWVKWFGIGDLDVAQGWGGDWSLLELDHRLFGIGEYRDPSRTKRPIHIKHNTLQRRRFIRASLAERRKSTLDVLGGCHSDSSEWKIGW